MSKKLRIIFFVVILICDLLAVQFNYKIAEYIFKPLIVIWLLAYFVAQTSAVKSDLKKWIIGALVFSWLGDVFLLIQGDKNTFSFCWVLALS